MIFEVTLLFVLTFTLEPRFVIIINSCGI